MNEDFLKFLEDAVGHDCASAAVSALEGAASVSVRFNPFKSDSADFGCGTCRVPWSPHGYVLDRRPDFTLDPLLHCGAYYVQDSSAMFVGEVFRRSVCGSKVGSAEGRGPRVLDLCAAPGGKTTDLAASLRERFGNGFLLVANEVMGDRAAVLSENVARWGDPCVMVTCADPAAFSALTGFFDVILADVPCSGEGMFRKDPEALRQWSPETVSMCAARQRRIVADAWPALKDGGVFIYSTCTFNRFENDGNVAWMLENLDCEPLNFEFEDLAGWHVLRTGHGFSLVPGLVPGEGQFCAAVRKSGADCTDGRTAGNRRGDRMKSCGNVRDAAAKARRPVNVPAEMGQCKDWFSVPVEPGVNDRTGTVVAVPLTVAGDVRTVRGAVRTLRAGCAAGTVKGRDIAPSADLALCIMANPGAFPRVEVDRGTALAFLHRDSISLPDAPRGYLVVCYRSLPLGFVKNLGTRCNNLHPQSRRIRMDIGRESRVGTPENSVKKMSYLQ